MDILVSGMFTCCRTSGRCPHGPIPKLVRSSEVGSSTSSMQCPFPALLNTPFIHILFGLHIRSVWIGCWSQARVNDSKDKLVKAKTRNAGRIDQYPHQDPLLPCKRKLHDRWKQHTDTRPSKVFKFADCVLKRQRWSYHVLFLSVIPWTYKQLYSLHLYLISPVMAHHNDKSPSRISQRHSLPYCLCCTEGTSPCVSTHQSPP